MGTKHYPESFKLQIVREYNEGKSMTSLSRRYGVSYWSVHCWCGRSEKVNQRKAKGKSFSVVVVAEGAAPKGGEITIMGKRDNGVGVDNTKLGGVGQVVAKQLEELTGLEARNTTLGYMQRGGTPTAFDRVLSTKYGSKAMELALEGKFGVLTVIKNGKLDYVSLEDVVGNNTKIGAVSGNTAESNIRRVTMDHDLVKTAKNIGICLGE